MKLSSKEERWYKFADYYIASGNNIYESAVKAGYSKNYAKAQSYKLLENVGIQEYIDKRRKELADEKKWTLERLIDAFEDNYNESKSNGDIRVSNDSLKEIGKLCGHYVEQVQHSGDININIKPPNFGSDEE